MDGDSGRLQKRHTLIFSLPGEIEATFLMGILNSLPQDSSLSVSDALLTSDLSSRNKYLSLKRPCGLRCWRFSLTVLSDRLHVFRLDGTAFSPFGLRCCRYSLLVFLAISQVFFTTSCLEGTALKHNLVRFLPWFTSLSQKWAVQIRGFAITNSFSFHSSTFSNHFFAFIGFFGKVNNLICFSPRRTFDWVALHDSTQQYMLVLVFLKICNTSVLSLYDSQF